MFDIVIIHFISNDFVSKLSLLSTKKVIVFRLGNKGLINRQIT